MVAAAAAVVLRPRYAVSEVPAGVVAVAAVDVHVIGGTGVGMVDAMDVAGGIGGVVAVAAMAAANGVVRGTRPWSPQS